MKSTERPLHPDNDYTAKYLIVLRNSDAATRALLFGTDHRYLAEVLGDDDGLVLENLVREGRMCEPPIELARHDLLAERADLQCFSLG